MFPGDDVFPGDDLFPGDDVDTIDTGLLGLDAAKIYLNIPLARTTDDDELTGFIPAAQARVQRHLGRAPLAYEPLEVLATKMVLGEYWRTQRARRSGAGASDGDSGPGGYASLQARLTELLGEPVDGAGGGVPAPVGSFPAAQRWPDPAERMAVLSW